MNNFSQSRQNIKKSPYGSLSDIQTKNTTGKRTWSFWVKYWNQTTRLNGTTRLHKTSTTSILLPEPPTSPSYLSGELCFGMKISLSLCVGSEGTTIELVDPESLVHSESLRMGLLESSPLKKLTINRYPFLVLT